jgi:outer membrane protein assembly factor BamD (BamD/ComL family)
MSAQSALAAELGALDAARSTLASGDASGALAKLDDYSRAFPHGRLVLEAEVLRIDALAHAGQADQAKKRAESFLRRHPNSVLASRVRGYL